MVLWRIAWPVEGLTGTPVFVDQPSWTASLWLDVRIQSTSGVYDNIMMNAIKEHLTWCFGSWWWDVFLLIEREDGVVTCITVIFCWFRENTCARGIVGMIVLNSIVLKSRGIEELAGTAFEIARQRDIHWRELSLVQGVARYINQ